MTLTLILYLLALVLERDQQNHLNPLYLYRNSKYCLPTLPGHRLMKMKPSSLQIAQLVLPSTQPQKELEIYKK